MEREVAGVSSTALCRLPARRGRALRPEGGHRCTGADVPYRRMPSELGVRAGASRDVTSAPRPFAPGLLRPTTLGLRLTCCHRSLTGESARARVVYDDGIATSRVRIPSAPRSGL